MSSKRYTILGFGACSCTLSALALAPIYGCSSSPSPGNPGLDGGSSGDSSASGSGSTSGSSSGGSGSTSGSSSGGSGSTSGSSSGGSGSTSGSGSGGSGSTSGSGAGDGGGASPELLTGVAAVSAGADYTCVLLTNGTVQCWGDNSNGKVGYWNGTTTGMPITTPVTVAGLVGATAVSADRNKKAQGDGATCAVLMSGAVQCWGVDSYGELGNGLISPFGVFTTPAAVTGLANATSVSAGYYHTCALLSGGTVQCWGDNGRGQLGNGSTAGVATPVAVTGLASATAVSAGSGYTCALLSGGTVQCWGDNYVGELGNGSTSPIGSPGLPTPVTVTGLAGATAVSAGESHSCALLSGGTVQCWGDNSYGQLGNGAISTTGVGTPVAVTGLTGVTSLSAGTHHTCAVLANGTVQCWGDNSYGQFGNGSLSPPVTTPVAVTGVVGAVAVSAGTYHTCALLSGGTVQCWGGFNASGRPATPVSVLRGTTLPVPTADANAIMCPSAQGAHLCTITGLGVQTTMAGYSDKGPMTRWGLAPEAACVAGTLSPNGPTIYGAAIQFNRFASPLTGTGLTVKLNNLPAFGAEVILQGGSQPPYCALLTAATSTVTWAQFNTKCYDSPPDGVALTTPPQWSASAPGLISIQAMSGATAGTFDFCVEDLTPVP